jgi:hypothetical protein
MTDSERNTSTKSTTNNNNDPAKIELLEHSLSVSRDLISDLKKQLEEVKNKTSNKTGEPNDAEDNDPEIIVDNDENEEVVLDDTAIPVDMPYLQEKFDYLSLVMEIFSDEYRAINFLRESKEEVEEDLLQVDNAITDKNVMARCLFNKMVPNQSNLLICRQQLSHIKKKIEDGVEVLVYKLWLKIANKMGLKVNGRDLVNHLDIEMLTLEVNSYDKAKEVMMLLYISLDFFYKLCDELSILIQFKFHFKIVPNVNLKKERRHDNFIKKICSHKINEMRKKYNSKSSKYIGLRYTITRWDEWKLMAKSASWRIPKHIHPWMIRGRLVSTIVIFVDAILLFSQIFNLVVITYNLVIYSHNLVIILLIWSL